MKLLTEAVITPIKRVIGKRLDAYVRQRIDECRLRQYQVFGDESRLSIAPTASVQNALLNVKSGRITIEDHVFFGHNVTIVTGTHDIRKFGAERAASMPSSGYDVLIKKGAWLATNVTIIGPCTIGENAVVAACSLVREDVPPYSVVAGTPARIIAMLDQPGGIERVNLRTKDSIGEIGCPNPPTRQR